MKVLTPSISRRNFTRLLGASALCAITRPMATQARTSQGETATAPGLATTPNHIVRLSANENPYGPSPKGLQAMRDAFNLSCRYPDEQVDSVIEILAKMNGVDHNQIVLGDGSSEVLKLCAAAFTGPKGGNDGRGKLVMADPTFEAIFQYATVNGAETVKVPLDQNFAHDLSHMIDIPDAGMVYICNPNNPTASITPKDQLKEFLAKVSPKTAVLVDEAYFHYADSADYESVIPLIKEHPNLIVARTFSKIYGMAGLRCGYGVAQKEVIERLKSYEPWDSVNIMALAAAGASLNDPDQVRNGRRLNTEARAFVSRELDAMGYKQIPSQANFIMVDVRRPVVPLIQAMKDRHVHVGRLFPALPNHMRVTIGRKSEMDAFLAAFRQVMAA